MVACQKAAEEIGNIAENSISSGGQQSDYKNIEATAWQDRGYEQWEKAFPSSLPPEEGELTLSVQGPITVVPGVSLPPSEARDVARTVSGFLREWETFTPRSSDIADRIEPYSSPGRSQKLASRAEAGGRWGVCAREDNCVSSSTWLEETAPIITVVAGGGDWVLVRAQGLVRYSGPDTSLSGQVSERRFGLLLRQTSGRWGVSRAVAVNGDIIIL